MKVTFIFCAIGVAGFNADRQPGDREGSWISHGLGSVAAAAKAAGHDVNLIDLRQISGWPEFIERIQKEPADVYALSVAPVDHYSALKCVYEIKTHLPSSKVIVGGIHPSIFPDKYDFNVVDCVVMGEGEITFPLLLGDVEHMPKKVRGIQPNLDSLPWVDREIFDYKRELSCCQAPDQETPSVTMLAGRGCPYMCSYCQPAENAVFGKPYRMRAVSDVIFEMESLYERYQFKSVTFWDDTFTISPNWVSRFCDLYAATGIPANITVCSRADIICKNAPMIMKMASVGIDWIVIGMESGSQRLLDMIKKGTTVEQNYKAVEICHKYGIKVFATYMYGLPTETREESTMTARMIQETAPEFPSPFWFAPIEGTEIYDLCERNQLILEKDADISRTGVFAPRIKDIDYEHIRNLMLSGV